MKNLVEQLQASGYLQFYLFFGEMNLRYKDWAGAATTAPEPLRSLVSLFLLGEPMARPAAACLVGDDALERLERVGVLVAEQDQVRSDSFYLLVHRGLFYFCQMTPDPFAYVGEDSLALSHYQTPIRESRVLDLCAGPGLQSMVAALRGNRVTAVECSERACAIHRLNLEINGLTDRVEVVPMAVEAFADTPSEKYSQILFNPPLVPMPAPAQGFPAAGYGGPDGLDLTDFVLQNYRKNLANFGHFEFVGMTVSPRRGPHPVAKLARRCHLQGRLHILSRHRLAGGSVVMEMHAASLARARSISTPSARQELSERYQSSDHFFLFFARLKAATRAKEAGLATVDMSASHYGGWFS
ncbi:MAG TPA: methyltransferase [Verrucomicrobiota bacterium]|nr:hypothetical protein [Verrucomicrobiales bacterium]HRI12618.1 methyltransferase [Verrucomicrobiota bacterium]